MAKIFDIFHQYSASGSHQIVVSEKNSGVITDTGDWAGFNNYASVEFQGDTYIAVTEFFAGGILEPDKIYRVSKDHFKVLAGK